MIHDFFGFENNRIWSISAKYANKRIDCTSQGILRCKAKCCFAPFWPGCAGEGDSCFYLSDKGCKLNIQERPIICLLYPFRINKNNKLILHGRIGLKSSCCYPNLHKGNKTIIENLAIHFSALFGEKTTENILIYTSRNIDYQFEVSEDFLRRYRQEEEWAIKTQIPQPRE